MYRLAQGKLKFSTWLWMPAFTNAVPRAAKWLTLTLLANCARLCSACSSTATASSTKAPLAGRADRKRDRPRQAAENRVGCPVVKFLYRGRERLNRQKYHRQGGPIAECLQEVAARIHPKEPLQLMCCRADQLGCGLLASQGRQEILQG